MHYSDYNKIIKSKGSKYRNTKTEYNGKVFDSKKEADYCLILDMLVKKGEVLEYETQVKYPIIVNKEKICTYILDFKVKYKDRIEYIDVKGFKTGIYRLKKKLMKAVHKIDIKEI